MSENLWVALITGCSALLGGLIGALISMYTAKLSADREDKRRRQEIERKIADERIKNLYDSLLSIVTPGPPYDEFFIDRETQKWIIEEIQKNELYASPELLDIFWDLRRAYYGEGEFKRDMEWEILRLVSSEHSKLKELIGYGRILEKESIIKTAFQKFKSKIEPIYTDIRNKISLRKARRRRRIVK